MNKNKKIGLRLCDVLFIFFGIIIFFNPDIVVKFISYFIGGVLLVVGIYKTANYYIKDKNLGVVNTNELAFGISAIILGLLFIFLASTIELLLRIIVGGYILVAGIGRIINTFYMTNRDSKFYALIIVGIIMIITGIYIILVSNIALSIVGLILFLYGIIDLISVFVYKKELNGSKVKEIEIKEAEVEEKEEE